MRTKLFEWAENQGFGLKDLAEMTGYSERHLRRIRDEGFPVTEDFQAGVVFKMGDWARSLFFGPVSPRGDALAPPGDASSHNPPTCQESSQERVSGHSEYPSTGEAGNGSQGAK